MGILTVSWTTGVEQYLEIWKLLCVEGPVPTRPVSVAQIAHMVGMSEPEVMKSVANMIRLGAPICAVPGGFCVVPNGMFSRN